MAVIKIGAFGGEFPSTSPRALPSNAAQVAFNILASTPEYRPLAGDSATATSTVSNPKTLYRLARTASGEFSTVMSTGWITKAEVVNYVKGQVNDDATERTYYTFGDGSQAPRVMDVTGQDRKLGVPAPTEVPTVVAEATPQFTETDRETAVGSLKGELLAAFQDALVPAKIGAATPTEGYYKAYPPVLYRVFRLTATGGRIADAYTGAPDEYNWVLDPTLGGTAITDGGLPYHAIPIPAYGDGYTLDETKLRTSLAALLVPGTQAGSGAKDEAGNPVTPTPLLTATQIDDLVRGMKNVLDPEFSNGAALAVAPLRAAVDRVKAILDNSNLPTTSATVTAYYTKYATEINDRISAFAVNIFNTAVSLVATPRADGGTAAITASSTIYGTGSPNRSYAVANIVSNINTNFTAATGSGGVKTLDIGAVTVYLNAGYKAILDTQTGNSSEIAARLSQVDVRSYVQALANQIAYGNLGSTSERPLVVDASGQAAALKTALAAVKAAADAVTTYYAAAKDSGKITTVLQEYSDKEGLSDKIPKTVERIIGDRFYIATYVTDWGEESAPSPVSESIQIDQNDHATVTIGAPPSGRFITKWRLYRSNAGSQAATFQFVDELDIGTLTYKDETRAAALGEPCPTLTWLEPPSNLRGLVGMPNGVMAGFFDNTICFCDPYHPYAWPVEYQITTEFPIVNLGVTGQTLVVGTRGRPYFVSGSDSASMSALKSDAPQACVSARSMVAVQGGVVYASPDGLCLADQSGVKLLTAELWTREDWQKLRPETIVAAEHEGVYVFMYDAGASRGCYALGAGKLVELDLWGTAMFVDLPTDTLYVVNGTTINAAFRATDRRTARWKSNLMTFEAQAPLAWAKVYSDFTEPVTLRWTADGQLRHTMTFTSLEPQRLPPGRWLEHEVEIESRARVTKVVLTTSSEELKAL